MKKLLTILLLFSLTAHAQPKIKWPGNKKAVIVLTYDDALLSQLNTAVPQLEAANLKATFFLTSDITAQTIPRWRMLSAKGFELGNHTIFHPCMATDNPVRSNNYTPYQIIREIEVMNRFLFAVDGKTTRTFAYPCTETTVGGKSYVDTLKYYNLVKYARIGGGSDAIVTDFKNLNPLLVPSYGLDDNTTGQQLIDYVKRVEQTGGMGVLMFHGIGGEYLTVSTEAHQQLITYLKLHQIDIWVPTFQQAMDYALGVSKQL